MENKKELYTALIKAQAEMPLVGMSANNPFFKSKYAPLKDLVIAARPILEKHGLAVIQYPDERDNGTYLVTMIIHSSGQEIVSSAKINPAKTDIQSFGSYMSYLCRYTYKSMLGIVTSEDEDDGEIAMGRHHQPAPQHKPQSHSQPSDKISKDMMELLTEELRTLPDLARDIKEKLKLKDFAELTRSQFTNVMRRVREIKSMKG